MLFVKMVSKQKALIFIDILMHLTNTIRIILGEEKPLTTTKEWEEATNEYLREQKSNPITGISSEGYKGKGYVTIT